MANGASDPVPRLHERAGDAAAAPAPASEKIGIIFVHGIGEQRRFSHLDGEVRPLIDALLRRPAKTTFEISAGSASTLRADQDTWSTQDGAPVRAVVKYDEDTNGTTATKMRELEFHEVWWADVNEQYTFKKQFLFWMWGLGMWWMPFQNTIRKKSGVMHSPVFPKGSKKRPQKGRPWVVRLQLYAISNLFLMGAFSVGAVMFVIKRVLGYAGPDFVRTFVNYLSAVRLYTQAERTGGGFLDAYKEPPRVSIRRRMIRTITDVAQRDYDRWYIFAHSLGAVVAFNGVMENNLAIPNYLDRKRWCELGKKGFAGPGQNNERVSEPMLPARPLWLGDTDVVYRERLFARFAGLLTYGSPLDKFAMLWPAQVPINGKEKIFFQPPPAKPGDPPPKRRTPEWINVYDPTDPVGASLQAFGEPDADSGVPAPANYGYCAGPWWLVSHLEFFKVHKGKNDELSDAILTWVLKGEKFEHAREPLPWFPPDETRHKVRMGWRQIQQFIVYIVLLLLAAVSLPFIVNAIAKLSDQVYRLSPDVPKALSWPILSVYGILKAIVVACITGLVWLSDGLRTVFSYVGSYVGIPPTVWDSEVSQNVFHLFLGVAIVTLIAGVIGRFWGFDEPDKRTKPPGQPA